MSEENISIKIKDEIDPEISSKLKDIAKQAITAHSGVTKLQSALKVISNSSGLQKLQTELAKTGLAQQKLLTEINKTNAAYFNSEAALNKAIAAETKATQATVQLTAAQNNSATAAQKLAISQAKAATALAQSQIVAINVTSANAKAATAQTQSQIAAQQLATAQTRAATAQTQSALASARLAAAQTATGTAASNAATAANRAALSALRLANAQAKATQTSRSATAELIQYAKAGAAILGFGFSTKVIIDIGDAYTILQNKLQNVTDSQEQVNFLTREIFNIANKTRSEVESTTTAFVRFDRALNILGKSQKESLRLTETVNKALIVSGAAPQEATSALLQLSQAFNSGRLQGDEFRAISENMPIILDAVAKALGAPVNQLKQLASEGKITSEVLFNAFKIIESQVDKTFAKSIPTVGQALTVGKNKAIEFFGELNKSVGFTTTLANAILFLSEHIDILAAAFSVLGSAMLVNFGPNIVALIGRVSGAIVALTATIASNPIGLLIVGITAATTALVFFGDKIKVTSDGLVSLKDLALSVWSFIKDAAIFVAVIIKDTWNKLIDFISEKTNGFGERFRDIGSLIVASIKDYLNFVIGAWSFAFKTIIAVWESGPAAFEKLFKDIVNFAIEGAQFVLEAWQNGLSTISMLLENIAPNVSKSINDALAKTKIKFPKLDYGKEAENFSKRINKIASDSFGNDFLGNAGKAILERASNIAKARKLSEQNNLRGSGESQISGSGSKEEIKRAVALEKVNLQLDNELSRLFKLQPAREAQAKLDQIEETLISKKIKLTESEKESIFKKIEALQDASEVQKQFDSIYSESVGPAKIYNATLEAANKLLAQGAISKENYTRAITKASEAYANSSDPLRQYNKDLDEQFKLLEMLPKQRQIEQQIIQIQNKLLNDGIILDSQQIANMKERLELLQEQEGVSNELNKIYGETKGAKQSLEDQEKALNKAYEIGLLSLNQYSLQLSKLSVEMANLKLQIGEGSFVDILIASFGQLTLTFKGALAEMTTAFGNFFQSFTDGFANSIGRAIVYSENFGDSIKEVAKGAVASLISALVKLGMQFVINAALGKSVEAGALAAHTAMSTAAAATTAIAWAPAASMVSLASFGANAAPASAGITSTSALSESIALASLPGFMDGGYSGDFAKNQIAGVVHGKEFVLNAETTARVGINNLQSLQDGAAFVQSGRSNESNSVAGFAHNGDVYIEIKLPEGATRKESYEAGEAAAEGYFSKMRKLRRTDKEATFYGAKA